MKKLLAAIVALLLLVGFTAYAYFTPQLTLKKIQAAAVASNTTELGTALYTRYLYPFELAAVLLLVAIIAAIVLTMRHRRGLKVQDVGAQIAVRREDRVRVLKMPAERGE